MLDVCNLTVSYDKAMILNDISLRVGEGELVSLIGPNGAGKSTLLRTITGLVLWEKGIKRGTLAGNITIQGTVRFQNEDIQNLAAHDIARRGLILCPERRRPFREMTVLDNLYAGAYLVKDQNAVANALEQVYTLFPILAQRTNQISGTLSGGEQQMLAVGRSMMSQPRLLCIDEPSTGLAPIMREEVFNRIAEIKKMGITVLLVEQEVSAVFELAERNYVLSAGRIIAEGKKEELLGNEVLRKTYLGL
jgi:branched-chain amino acid transport system ATP-binding protein